MKDALDRSATPSDETSDPTQRSSDDYDPTPMTPEQIREHDRRTRQAVSNAFRNAGRNQQAR